MLNLFNSFVVPGVPHVTVYHDDQDEHLYYMIPELPRVLRHPDGTPMFSLIAFARDLSLMREAAAELPPEETEGGLLSATFALEVSDQDQAKIREHIQGQQSPMLRFRPIFLGGPRVRVAPLHLVRPIKLAYPHWIDGSVGFDIIPGDVPTFVKARAGSEKPSLVNRNLASFEALLGQEGVRLINSSLKKNWCPGTVRYSVSFVARIPSLSISITGNARDAYEEVKQHSQITEYYNGNGKVHIYKYPAVSSLSEMRSMFASLKIDVDVGEFRADAAGAEFAQEVQKQLEQMALELANNYLTNRFCAPGFTPGLKAEKIGTDPFAHDPNRPAGVEPQPGNQLWLKDFNQSMEGSIDFKVTSRTNLTVTKHPNSALYELITPEEVERNIIEADLNTPIFHVLDVTVVVNADFERDPIAAVKVMLVYDQTDERTGERKFKAEEFLFDTAKETRRFRTTMARTADGAPKNSYRYRSQIIYKNAVPSQDIREVVTNETKLVINYASLSCVNVNAVWGAVPADTVERVLVQFRYPGLTSPSAEKEVQLAPDRPEGSWFTYTEANPSREYEYRLSYFLSDGQRLDFPIQQGSSDSLVVNAPFEDRLEATFVPQGSFPPLSAVVVTVRYQDPDNGLDVTDVHTFRSLAENWSWSIRIVDRSKRGFEYKADLLYSDGTREEGQFQPGEEGTLFVGQTARKLLTVQVIGSLLDFATTWRLVIVRLRYADPAHAIEQEQIFQLTAGNHMQDFRWSIALQDPAARSYSWQVQAFAQDPVNNRVTEPAQTEDPLLVLQL